jgi:hypothetical protein
MSHTCHNPYCDKEIPPKMLACRTHWYQLPYALRVTIWATYVPGQEITKTPSPEYLAVAQKCIEYWKELANGTTSKTH